MWLFSRKPKPAQIVVTPPATSRVEVELHKGASVEAAQKAAAVNQHVKELLIDNGFILKISLAAGAKTKKKVALNGH